MYVVINAQTRQIVSKKMARLEANRVVGQMNKAAGSSCKFSFIHIDLI